MSESTIKCPKCSHNFELSAALTGGIRETLRDELQQELANREVDLRKQRETLKQEQKLLNKKRESLEEQLSARMAEKLPELEKKATAKLELKYDTQVKELQESMQEKDAALSKLRKHELELRKKQRDLETAREEAELELARKLDEERAKIRIAAQEKADETHRLKDLEKDKMINDLRVSLDDMKRKAEQGSMETQGEVLELDFEEQLRSFFPYDEIEPVKKGARGADVIQHVKSPRGEDCGALLWEMKNARNWSNTWIPKLKDDMREARATIPILVSVVLPEGVEHFGRHQDAWISDPASAMPLAFALREQLVVVKQAQAASEDQSGKMELLYQYLAGVEFKQKIEGIVEAFTEMKGQLDKERRAFEKQWKAREKQIERVIKNTVGLYGDMQGIIGGSIATIPALELDENTEPGVQQLGEGGGEE